MKTITPENKIAKTASPSIFLAGTTPRNRKKDWRKQFILMLQNAGFEGVVYNPDYTELESRLSYEDQILWEIKAMKNASLVVFWVDRDLPKRPGLTTNMEFGYWLRDDKIIYGRPDKSEKCFYLDYVYKFERKKKPLTSLEALAKETIKYISNL